MESKNKKLYRIELSMPVDGTAWVAIADDVEAAIKNFGIDAWGINNQEIDRDLMVKKSDLTVIEGVVESTATVETIRDVITRVLGMHGLIGKIELN